MARRRIVYLCSWPIGARGEGAASFVYDQIECLSRDVEAVYVVHRFADIAEARWGLRHAPAPVAIDDLWRRDVAAIEIATLRWPTRVTRRSLTDDIWRAGASVAKQLGKRFGRIDAVHAHVVLPAGLLGASIARILGVPLLLQEHSGPFEMHLDTVDNEAAVRRVLREARVVAAVGEALAARIALYCAPSSRIRVVPNLVRTDIFTPRPRRAATRALRTVSVGSLTSVKGFDILLDAVAKIARSGTEVQLRLVGDGELRGDLAARVRALGLSGQVSLVGALPRLGVIDAIADADVYVCPSRHETFGLAAAEALATGRPVVSTRCGGPDAFVDESCGAVVAGEDPCALAEAIVATGMRRVEFDPVSLHTRIARMFGPGAFRQRMLALYDDLCNGHDAR